MPSTPSWRPWMAAPFRPGPIRPTGGATRWRPEMPGKTFEQRLFAKIMIDRDDPDACWIWTASRNHKGYGQIKRDGRPAKAHRVVYELYEGPIPAGMQLDHICHERACVNPEHLRPVTNKANTEHRAGADRNSRSGVRGVSWHARDGKWQVRVEHNYRQYF